MSLCDILIQDKNTEAVLTEMSIQTARVLRTAKCGAMPGCYRYMIKCKNMKNAEIKLSNEALAAAHAAGLELLYDEYGLALTDGELKLYGDFTHMLPRIRQKNLEREFLVRAARIKKTGNTGGAMTALDATAGLGEDSLLLAAAGFQVELYEADPVIAALLRDSLDRAAAVPELADIARRMHLHEEDSISAMKRLADMRGSAPDAAPDVILLDPMFPERRKSALVKKKFQLLQRLESPCTDQDGSLLLAAAESARPRRIIIKRPLKGSYLAGRRPGYSITGKAIRYDCIVTAP